MRNEGGSGKVFEFRLKTSIFNFLVNGEPLQVCMSRFCPDLQRLVEGTKEKEIQI